MENNYKQTMKYSYIKILVFVAFILCIIFYFKINIFNLSFFKSKNQKDKKYIHKEYNTNRDIHNAMIKENYRNKKLSDFYIKTAFNCCNDGNGIPNIDKLQTIISNGFRCLDFNLTYMNNTIQIKDQPKNETFYNALEIIDKRCFSNMYCNNNEDPLIINMRFVYDDININYIQASKSIFLRLHEMFKTLNSKYILGNQYSLLQKYLSTDSYNDVLNMKLNDFYGKIIIMCNFDYNIINANGIDNNNDVLQYIHFNTCSNVNSIDDIVSKMSMTEINKCNSSIIENSIHDIIKTETEIRLIDYNKDYPMMIVPDNSDDNIINNVPSLVDLFGYTFRAVDFSTVNDFEDDNIDNDLTSYINEFNIAGSAFILKPISLRNNS